MNDGLGAGQAADVATRLAQVGERIARACARTGRHPSEVRLVAVSKRHDADAIRAAYAAGQRWFGENYVQELASKAESLADLPDLRWRFIGHLQRNKLGDFLRTGAALDSLDSLRLAHALEKRAQAMEAKVEVLIQVNVAGEPQKAGCLPEALGELLSAIRELPHVRVKGLMTIPPAEADPQHSRPWFRRLRELRDVHGLADLSMGMSADLEVAIEEGATMVRVGTAIFGPRPG